jgi:hypothetical protein
MSAIRCWLERYSYEARHQATGSDLSTLDATTRTWSFQVASTPRPPLSQSAQSPRPVAIVVRGVFNPQWLAGIA